MIWEIRIVWRKELHCPKGRPVWPGLQRIDHMAVAVPHAFCKHFLHHLQKSRRQPLHSPPFASKKARCWCGAVSLGNMDNFKFASCAPALLFVKHLCIYEMLQCRNSQHFEIRPVSHSAHSCSRLYAGKRGRALSLWAETLPQQIDVHAHPWLCDRTYMQVWWAARAWNLHLLTKRTFITKGVRNFHWN